MADNILHDARYDYLGRLDYIKLTEKLFREESEYGKVDDRLRWIEKQKKMLRDHEFITNTAKLLRSVSVDQQITSLVERME